MGLTAYEQEEKANREVWKEMRKLTPYAQEVNAKREAWREMGKLRKRIAELENQWISVEDRLPELEDNSVLVYFTTTSIETVHIEDNFKNIPNGFDKEGNQLYTKWYICSGITHWMPLPEPPKEQE